MHRKKNNEQLISCWGLRYKDGLFNNQLPGRMRQTTYDALVPKGYTDLAVVARDLSIPDGWLINLLDRYVITRWRQDPDAWGSPDIQRGFVVFSDIQPYNIIHNDLLFEFILYATAHK